MKSERITHLLEKAQQEVTMELNDYNVRYWSSVEWGWVGYAVLAADVGQVRAAVDAESPLEFRKQMPRGVLATPPKEAAADSLEIHSFGAVKLPYRLAAQV